MKQTIEFVKHIDEANRHYRQPELGLYKIGKNYFIDYASPNDIELHLNNKAISKTIWYGGGIFLKGKMFDCNKRIQFDDFIFFSVIWIGDELAVMEFFSNL